MSNANAVTDCHANPDGQPDARSDTSTNGNFCSHDGQPDARSDTSTDYEPGANLSSDPGANAEPDSHADLVSFVGYVRPSMCRL